MCARKMPLLLNLRRALIRNGTDSDGTSRMSARACIAIAVVGLGASTTAGCGATGSASGEIAGFAAGSAAGALTANPFVGVATGLAVRFAASEAEAYLDRRRQAAIHAAIATAAGSSDEGNIVPWSVELDIPPRHAHGEVQTIRTLGGQIACREVLYNVKSRGEAAYFVGVICRHDGTWRWAVSEPTVQRW
jgi:hypothetical protein